MTPSQDVAANLAEPWMEIVRRKVEGIRFGSVQITVHEGRVTQVDALERTRLTSDYNGQSDPRRPKHP